MKSRQSSRSATVSDQKLIYVVDDEPVLLELAQEILEAHGYEVKTYRDPSEALAAFRRARHRPELILTDYHMRKMNGLEFAGACRSLLPTLKVAVISGTADRAIVNHAEQQPNEYLAKPYGPRELTRLVKKLVG